MLFCKHTILLSAHADASHFWLVRLLYNKNMCDKFFQFLYILYIWSYAICHLCYLYVDESLMGLL